MIESLHCSDARIHLYQANLAIDQPTEDYLLGLLSEDEVQRANRFRFEVDRRHFIAARGYLREILAASLGISAKKLGFGYSKYGKPHVIGPLSPAFNVSHAMGLAIYALSDASEIEAIGVDVESFTRKVEIRLVANSFFAPAEVDALFSLPESEQFAAFLRCWTRKEAFIKAKGDGLSLGLDQFEVDFVLPERAALLATHYDPADCRHWQMETLVLDEGFVGAMVWRERVG